MNGKNNNNNAFGNSMNGEDQDGVHTESEEGNN